MCPPQPLLQQSFSAWGGRLSREADLGPLEDACWSFERAALRQQVALLLCCCGGRVPGPVPEICVWWHWLRSAVRAGQQHARQPGAIRGGGCHGP